MPDTCSISSWTALASESQRARILPILEELMATLGQGEEASLAGGLAGIALFFGYCSRLPGQEACQEQAAELLSQAVVGVQQSRGAAFYSGFSGIAWAVEHLQQQFQDPGQAAEDVNGDVDEVLLELLAPAPWRGQYDLVSGLTGFSVYALERRTKACARQILARILDHLEAMAVPRTIGISWPTGAELLPPWQRREAPQGYFNLGLAHGVPGVLLVLAAMMQAARRYSELDARRAEKLLEGGMAWILSQFQDPKTGSYLASWSPLEQERAAGEGNRVAWCYGDLGVSLALLQVARVTGRSDWEAKSLSLARLAAARPVASSGVRDACLCHGSAGNALMFQRLHQQTGEDCFRQAFEMYLEHLLRARIPGGPWGGYTFYQPSMDAAGEVVTADPYHPDPSFLEGSAGVGLALLAAIGVEPAWDRCLLLSLANDF